MPFHFNIKFLTDNVIYFIFQKNRYVNNRYTQQYRATVGADFMAKEVMIDDRVVNLQVS